MGRTHSRRRPIFRGAPSVTDTVTAHLPTSTTFAYDDNGNMTSDGLLTYTYDDENQLVAVEKPNETRSEFVYDARLRRRERKEYEHNGSGWTLVQHIRYIYDGMRVLQERHLHPTQGIVTNRVTYTRGFDLSGSFEGAGGIGGLLARSESVPDGQPGNGQQSHAFYHADNIGNVTAMLNPQQIVVARYTYDPFGRVSAMSGPWSDRNVYRFSSKEYHETSGLYYYCYRFYSAELQRWMNRDPILEGDDVHVFRFSKNDPINWVDPLGLEPVPSLTSPGANPSLTLESVLQEQGLSRAACNLSSRQARAMARSGRAVRKSDYAHHIVAKNDARAAHARKVLKHHKIDVDDPVNGVALPKPLHQALHTNQYYDRIDQASKCWKTKEEALAGLQQIADDLAKLAAK